MGSLSATLVALSLHVVAAQPAQGGQTVLLDFSATWCGPCRQMEPVLHRLAAAGYPVRKVDVDQEAELAQRFAVGPIPCFVLLVNGQEVDRHVGATSADHLQEMFAQAGVAPRDASAGRTGPGSAGQRGAPAAGAGGPRTFAEAPPAPRTAPAGGGAPALPGPAGPARLPPPASAAAAGEVSRTAIERALAAAARLNVDDPHGHSVGSGTVVDSRGGEALIVTCAHLFRESKGQGEVLVDLCGVGLSKLPGRVLSYDLERDVALVVISPGREVPAMQIAPPGVRVQRGQSCFTIGCDHGADPSPRVSQVSGIDKFLGPSNVEVQGAPVEGRSGGGVFTADGLLIGVCNCADPAADEGLYAAASVVHDVLAENDLLDLLLPSAAAPAAVAGGPPALPRAMPAPAEAALAVHQVPAAASDPAQSLAAAALAADGDAAEVVCIVRSLDDPRARSEVIVLDRASADFLRCLAEERHVQTGRHATAHREGGRTARHWTMVGGLPQRPWKPIFAHAPAG